MELFSVQDLTFSYPGQTVPALERLSFDISAGEFLVIAGPSGCGKSTLLRQFKTALTPHGSIQGQLLFQGVPLKQVDPRTQASKIGFVQQNPDNQIIGTIVEEDVGFGPENLGVPTEEIWERVDASLEAVGMTEYRHHSPNKLSGGQKQRVAIAGILAMKPKCIVLDEPTAMLDPNGRKEVIATITKLNKEEHVTVILITHYMDEVIGADKVFVMDEGKVVLSGTPREVFSKVEHLKALRLDVPHTTELAFELEKAGLPMKRGILTIEEFTQELIKVAKHNHIDRRSTSC